MAISNFNALDWLVAAIIVFSIVTSAIRGFVREVMRLVTLALAIVLAIWLYRPLSVFFIDMARTQNLALLFAFSAVFLGTLLAGWIITWAISRFKKVARLEWADRLLGAAFGLVRGWMLGAVIFLGLTSFDIQSERVRGSELAPFLLPGARVIAALAPAEMQARFLVGYHTIQRWWDEQH
ncbi:MAG TPA: CvpA family protein [Terriglobia bacterium]|nr:CvpA family protein [Terriglobia bacterium]